MTELNIRQLMSGGIITNYFCTSTCRHCLYNCSPQWEKEYITPETAEKNLQAVRSLGCRSVHIGGGEPLLRPDGLATVLKIADDLGVAVEYVETNSSWFRDSSSAEAFLKDLRTQGLETLLVSISPFHNEHIPFFKVKGVIEAAGHAGVGIFPWVTDFVSDLSQFDPAKTHSLSELSDIFGRDYVLQVLERYWIHMGGRALETYRPLMGQKTFFQIMDQSTATCYGELSNTGHFHIDLFGNYIPGLCSGLSIAIEDLGKPLSDETYPVLTTLCRHGIRGLIKMAEDAFGYSPQKNLYINKCDLCTEVRTYLVQKDYGGSKELTPREFYQKS
ncbi:radical SAM protein [Thermodesulfobacteriota bacterium]